MALQNKRLLYGILFQATAEALRLRLEVGLEQRQIPRSCSIGLGTVHEYLQRAEAAGLHWPVARDWDEDGLEAALFGAKPRPHRSEAPTPDFEALHQQRQAHPHVTLQLLWDEYRQANPEGYRYSASVSCTSAGGASRMWCSARNTRPAKSCSWIGLSGRPHDNFVALNCASIPKNLAESILFGHKKGSFGGLMILQLSKACSAFAGAEDDRSTCDVIIADGCSFKNGAYTVPDAPGMGITINEKVYKATADVTQFAVPSTRIDLRVREILKRIWRIENLFKSGLLNGLAFASCTWHWRVRECSEKGSRGASWIIIAEAKGNPWVMFLTAGKPYIGDSLTIQNINFDLGRNLAARRQIAFRQRRFVRSLAAIRARGGLHGYDLPHIQRQLTGSLVLDPGYLGSEGHKLWGLLDHNVPPVPGPGSLCDVPGSLRPWPEYGVIQSNSPWVNSVYNSLSVRSTQRFSHGLSFLESYSYGRSIDDNSSVRPHVSDQQFPQNRYATRSDRGPSNFDVAYCSVTSIIYELPIGKGRNWLNTGGVVDAILDSWQVNTIMTFETSLPLDVISGTDPANVAESGYERPNYVPGQNPTLSNASPTKWFNTAAFTFPAPYNNGNVGRNTLLGPGFAIIDLSTIKQFVPGEGQTLQFRAEAFNSLNHPNFSPPQNTLSSSAFGTITSTVASMRQVQFALKFVF